MVVEHTAAKRGSEFIWTWQIQASEEKTHFGIEKNRIRRMCN